MEYEQDDRYVCGGNWVPTSTVRAEELVVVDGGDDADGPLIGVVLAPFQVLRLATYFQSIITLS
jgi:hypothetical protein